MFAILSKQQRATRSGLGDFALESLSHWPIQGPSKKREFVIPRRPLEPAALLHIDLNTNKHCTSQIEQLGLCWTLA